MPNTDSATEIDSPLAERLLTDLKMFPPGGIIRQVRGGSMTGDLITDGDFVVLDPTRLQVQGDICVVVHDADGRRARSIGHICYAHPDVILHPSNKAFESVTITPEMHPVVEGVVAGVIRKVD